MVPQTNGTRSPMATPAISNKLAQRMTVKNPDLLAAYFRCMSSEKQREFFQLQSSPADKLLFLMRLGAYENGIPLSLVQ